MMFDRFYVLCIMGLYLALGSGFTSLIQDVDGWGEGFLESGTASYLDAR